MKTKHLFLATALMASFAACTNEEIVSDVQQNVVAGRPTVDNVKFTFGENVDSRLVYNKGWKWEATDKIGALLMDNVNNIGSPVWKYRYTLSEYIHTSYPFSYNVEEGTWGTPGKLLEGNYFFAFPWESYEGQRQVTHSLINQKQTGITADVRAESYADNQFFIGYDRIIAGTQDAEALNNVSMTSVLGAVELRIVNTGTQTYNINKVVLSGDKLASQLTFNPTSPYFNTANYLGLEDEQGYDAGKNYDKDETLRSVVKVAADENNDNFAQIIIEGEDRALLPDAENTAYVLIMANPDKFNKTVGNNTPELTLSVYTDEGMVAGIDLTKINKASSKYGYVTDAAIEEIHPEVKNVITVQIDDNAFEVPTDMNVFNSQDLEQFIVWNSTISGKRSITATLQKDVTLTEAAYEALISKNNMKLTINGNKELTLVEELPIDVLDTENLNLGSFVTVKALCDLELTEDSEIPASIEVAEGVELTIADKKVNDVDVVNYGVLTIEGTANIKSGSIVNYAEMTVAENADVLASVTNYAELTTAGEMNNVTNKSEATITLEEGADVTVVNNYGTISTADDAELVCTTNNGEIEVVEGAVVKVTNESGTTYREVSGTIEAEAEKSAVNTWVVTADAKVAANLEIEYLIINDGADLEVVKDKALTVTEKLTIEGSTSTEGEGSIAVKDLTIEEEGYWKNEVAVAFTGKLTNDGYVVNDGTVAGAYGATKSTTGFAAKDWKGNEATINTVDPSAKSELQKAWDAAVVAWATGVGEGVSAGGWNAWFGSDASVYAGNPNDYTKFLTLANGGWSGVKVITDLKAKYTNSELPAAKLNGADNTPAEFKAAVKEVLENETRLTKATDAVLKDKDATTAGKNAAGLYWNFERNMNVFKNADAIRDYIANATQSGLQNNAYVEVKLTALEGASIWAIPTATITNAISVSKKSTFFMVESDNIVKVAQIWKKYTVKMIEGGTAATDIVCPFYLTDTEKNSIENLNKWINWLNNQSSPSNNVKNALNELNDYMTFINGLDATDETKYYTPAQITAAGNYTVAE